ncbi:MAG: dihydrofolate reductase family protein [Nakamurella sp.]
MKGPRVVVTATMSIDGRIALWPNRILLEPEVGAAWSALETPGATSLLQERQRPLTDRFGSTMAVLSGSGSFGTEPGSRLPSVDDDPDALLHDFLPAAVCAQPAHQKWFVVTDSRGRVRWSIKRVDGSDLLVLVTRSTPPEYLAYLRAEQICYLVVGDDRVNFGVALQRIRDRLGVACVLADGGGGLNGALLRAGLVDELELVMLPVAIGGTGIPSVFEGEPLGPAELLTRLTLTASRVTADGAIWLSYDVNPTPNPA